MFRIETITIDRDFVGRQIPPRKKDSHKGMNGRVCMIGGSRIYHGAPFLMSMAAMKTGIDLVYLGVPQVVSTPIRAMSPDLIVIPLPDSKLTRGNVTKLKNWIPDVDCIGIGPGLGPQNEKDVVYAIKLLANKTKAFVVDADAQRPAILELSKDTRLVVTPHAGEFERLYSVKLPSDKESRVELVRKYSKENHLTTLLKGPTDIISDGDRVGFNDTHSPSMTVGGTGDVLTGITAGLLAKGVPPFEAASSAAYINGAAGSEATKSLGLHLTASAVVNQIPNVMKQFDRLE